MCSKQSTVFVPVMASALIMTPPVFSLQSVNIWAHMHSQNTKNHLEMTIS